MKSRFCPSPTGFMHLGNARTALFSALAARAQQGQLLLRIEDTDVMRSAETYTEGLLADLQWMGLTWQEGPDADLGNGPYWQSQRQAIYDHYYEKLTAEHKVYPCFCSEEQLALSRKVQLASGKPPRYAGTCQQLTPEQIAAKKAEGLQPTLRFKVPTQQIIQFTDLVKGLQTFHCQDIGDFIIRRGDGTASFIYCNAIDDALMGVTHALRGEDHLTNTPRQLLILQALDLPAPHYGHISLIMGPDGTPLSKRHGSKSIKELREQGYFASAIVNYLARLGHHYANNHWMSLAELAEHFRVEALGSAPARFDAAQMLHWQKEAVAHCDDDTLGTWMGEATWALVPAAQRTNFIATIKHNVIFPEDAKQWAELFFKPLSYSESQRATLKAAGKNFFEQALAALNHHGTDFKALANSLQQQLNVKGKALFQPLRIAVTGVEHGPEMGRIIELLGLAEVKQRLQTALTICS